MTAPSDASRGKQDPRDLRDTERAPIKLRVDYAKMNSFFADYTINISKGGTFIKTANPLAIGTRCVFAFSLPALSEPLQLEGEVAWILPVEAARTRGEEAGMGVRFLFADGEARRAVEALVERMMEESLGREVAQALLQKKP